ncbi:MAG: hypothetical protein ACJAYU_002347 [Bradymonadia bacterium]
MHEIEASALVMIHLKEVVEGQNPMVTKPSEGHGFTLKELEALPALQEFSSRLGGRESSTALHGLDQ